MHYLLSTNVTPHPLLLHSLPLICLSSHLPVFHPFLLPTPLPYHYSPSPIIFFSTNLFPHLLLNHSSSAHHAFPHLLHFNILAPLSSFSLIRPSSIVFYSPSPFSFVFLSISHLHSTPTLSFPSSFPLFTFIPPLPDSHSSPTSSFPHVFIHNHPFCHSSPLISLPSTHHLHSIPSSSFTTFLFLSSI